MAKPKSKTGQYLTWGFLGLIGFSLIGLGTGGGGLRVSTVATVDGQEVTTQAYGRALQDEIRRVAQGGSLPVAEAVRLGLDRVALDRLLGQAALDAEAARQGLRASDAAVAGEIASIPAFQGASGFDREAYRFALRNAGLSITEFEEQVRGDVTRTLLISAIGRPVPHEAWTDAALGYALARRDVTWARVPPDLLTTGTPEPAEDELAAWYEENAERFARPAEKVLALWHLAPAEAVEPPSEDEIAARYAERVAEFRRPARRMLDRLVYPDAAAAEAALARIEAGESFDDLVAERGLAPEDVDQGLLTREDLGAAAAEAVFALEAPGIAGPVDTPLGPALYQVNALLDATETPLADVRDEIAEEIALAAGGRAIRGQFGDMDDVLAGGGTLEEMQATFGGTLAETVFVEGGEDESFADPVLREAAAGVAEGDFPEILTLEDGGVAALRLEEERPARTPDLAEVREDALDAWRADARAAALLALAEDLAGRIQAGESFEEAGLAPQTAADLARDAAPEGAPPGLVEAAFAAETGAAVAHRGGDEVAVVRVDGAGAAPEGDPRAELLRTAVEAQAERGMAEDVLEAFVDALVARAEIDLDPRAKAAVEAQLP